MLLLQEALLRDHCGLRLRQLLYMSRAEPRNDRRRIHALAHLFTFRRWSREKILHCLSGRLQRVVVSLEGDGVHQVASSLWIATTVEGGHRGVAAHQIL